MRVGSLLLVVVVMSVVLIPMVHVSIATVVGCGSLCVFVLHVSNEKGTSPL